MNQKNTPWFLLLASAMWGSSFIASKICIANGMQTFETLFFRFSLGSILTWLVFHKELHGFTPTAIRSGLLLGFGNALSFILEMNGLLTVPASRAGFLTATNTVILSLMFCAVHRLRPTVFSLTSALLSVAGVGVLSLTGGSFSSIAVGDLLLLGAAFMYAVNNMIASRISEHDSRLQVTFIQVSTAAAIMGILALLQGFSGTYSFSGLAAVSYQAIFPTVLCNVIKNTAMKYRSPVLCTLILTTESVFCTILSALLLGDSITLRTILGSALITVAIIIEILHPIRPTPSAIKPHPSTQTSA